MRRARKIAVPRAGVSTGVLVFDELSFEPAGSQETPPVGTDSPRVGRRGESTGPRAAAAKPSTVLRKLCDHVLADEVAGA